MEIKRLKPEERQAVKIWNDLIASILSSADINPEDTPVEIEARKKRLEADDEAWFCYYFEQY